MRGCCYKNSVAVLLCSHHVIAYSQDQVAYPLKEKRSLGVFACDWCMLGESLASLLQTLSGQAVLRRSEADEVEVYLSTLCESLG